jgi:hypothetical protein
MQLDPVFLSRVQFGLTIMLHYLFPPLTIGLGLVMVYLEGMYLRTKEPIYETAAYSGRSGPLIPVSSGPPIPPASGPPIPVGCGSSFPARAERWIQ